MIVRGKRPIVVRIKNLFPTVIHHNQTGYVYERFTGETVRYIFDIMEVFNFRSDFIHFVKMSHTNIESRVLNNGSAFVHFRLKRGVRQGDPLCPYLFLHAIETLAIVISENKEINGIKIEQEETKLLQYAELGISV